MTLFYAHHDLEIAQELVRLDILHGKKVKNVWKAVKAYLWRKNPEAFRFDPDTAMVDLDEPLSDLIREMNPLLTDKAATQLFAWNVCFSNSTGFKANHSRANYFEHIDLDKPPAKLNKVIICGGFKFKGVRNGNRVYPETIDANEKLPTWAELKPKWWLYFPALIVSKIDGHTFNFPYCRDSKGVEHPVLIPFISGIQVSCLYDTVVKRKPYPWVTEVLA